MTEHTGTSFPHEAEIIGRISGFKPAVTGRVCDSTNELIQVGETALVELEKINGTWELIRTQKSDTEMELDSSHSEACQAVVEAELMSVLSDEMFGTLGNPEVKDVSPRGEARGEWKDVLEA